MTPAQIQQKLDDLRNKKAQIDADISAMATSVDEALKPIRENRSEFKLRWEQWKKYNSALMREKLVGKDKGEKRVRVFVRLFLGKAIADAYADAWEAAPKAIENTDELIGDLLSASDRLQEAKKQVLAVQIPPSAASASQLATIKSSLNGVKVSSNLAIDTARAILTKLPDRRKKIKPLISAALKLAKVVLEKLNKREDRLEDRKLVIAKEKRLGWIDDGQKAIKPFLKAGEKFLKDADDFVDGAPAREQALRSRQVQLNTNLSSIQSGLSLAPGGSPNRSTVSPGSAALHLLAIGAVAAGICAFDYHERRA
jgi:chromosome segregation ATPase